MPASAEPTRRRRGVRLAVRIVVPVLFAFSLWYLFTHVIRFGYTISGSMEPTLEIGDYYVVRLHAYDARHRPRRGDIIVFAAADGDAYVKRVVGLSGERFVVVGGNVLLNGRWLSEPYLKEQPGGGSPVAVTVPEDSVYVMGDNRNVSADSRDDGPVPGDRIMGRVTRIAWPLDHARVFGAVSYPGLSEP